MLNCDDLAAIVRNISPWAEVKLGALQKRTQHTIFLCNTGAPCAAAMVIWIESKV